MADSTTNLDLISASQASKEITANALLDAASTATVFGRRASTCVGLTWGYYGGNFYKTDKTITTLANGTVALTGSATNYIEATADGVVSANTTAFTSGRLPLYVAVTDTTSVTSYTDERCVYYPALGATPSNRVVALADATSITPNANTTDIATHANTQAAGTLTVNAPTGTPTDTQKLILRISSTNVQTFSWNAAYAGSTDLSLPTATSGSGKYDYLGFMWNSTASKWQFISKVFGF